MALDPEILAAIAKRLADHAGLELPAWVVEARATTRIALAGCSPEDYLELIGSARGAGELAELIEAVRVGESRLFRHRSQVAVLADTIAPALRGKRAVRVWSAGCAAGEEPYTLAIVLSRALTCPISIVATDVSADALDVARAATYPRSALEHVPAPYRDAFEVDDAVIRVRPEIAALVDFAQANLVDGLAPRGCDLVWCRNVLIYFTPEARRRAIDRLVAATVPGGFVFVGYSESLRDIPELERVRANETVYYVRRTTAPDLSRRTPTPIAVPIRPSFDRTPPPERPSRAAVTQPLPPPSSDVFVLAGHPDAARVTAELLGRFSMPGLQRLTIDLDAAEVIDDALAPVLRRARAAARAVGIELAMHATRAGARRWLARHRLEDES